MNEIIAQTEAGIAAIAASVSSEAATMAPVKDGRLRDSIVWKTSLQGSGEIPDVPTPKKIRGLCRISR
jgi:hypothetical protein